MAAGYNYHLTIPWHVARAYFKMLKERANDAAMTLDDKELYRMQGKAQAYKMLDNMPEQLSLRGEDDKPEEKEKENGST